MHQPPPPTTEVWLPIQDQPGYWVSNEGRVWSGKTNRFLRPGRDVHGYQFVILSQGGDTSIHRVHVLVATAFHGPRPSKHDVNHLNGIRSDNRHTNLEWATRRRNTVHAIELGLCLRRGEDNPGAKLTRGQVGEIRRAYARGGVTQNVLARRVGVSRALISLIVRNKLWRDA